MNIDDFKKAADNPNLIPGIYNYCDRWCEKCSFTSRCMLASVQDPNQLLDEESVFESVKNSFAIALQLLNEWAEKEGIDLDEISEEEDPVDFENERKEVDQHPLSQSSKTYLMMLTDWIDAYHEKIVSDQEIIRKKVEQHILPKDSLREVYALDEAYETVRWFQHQIYIKLGTAVRSMEFDPDFEDEIQNHGNGAAKVALLGTEQSIGAWGVLLQALPEQEDEILPILVQLERIRKGIEHYFPKVRKFKRPGFDD